MADYLPGVPIRQSLDNMVETADGTLWAYYILDGMNVSIADQDSVDRSVAAHERLFSALSRITSSEISLHSMKCQERISDITDKIKKGLPRDFTPRSYPYLTRKIASIVDRIESGVLRQFDRVYILAVRMGNPSVVQDTLLNLFVRSSTSSTVNLADKRRDEETIFSMLPREFSPRRADLRYLRWAADRASLRGVRVPMLPTDSAAVPAAGSFPAIEIDATAETTATLDAFVSRFTDGSDDAGAKARRIMRNTYKSISAGRALAVSHPGERSAGLPAGLVSYQGHLVVDTYPMRRGSMQTFTHLVDSGASMLDADWTLRFVYDSTLLSKDSIRSVRGGQTYLAETSTDEFSMVGRARTANETAQFHQLYHDQPAHIPMLVTTMFHFGAADVDTLTEGMDRVRTWFDSRGYSVQAVPGGQTDCYRQSMPCVPHSKLTKEYQQATTVRELAPAIPLRTSHTGDRVGFPSAINREDNNGRLVFFDWLGRPDRGNPSTLVYGAQGSGKSYSMKSDLSVLAAYHGLIHVFDPSSHGEHEAFAEALAGQDPAITTQAVNLAAGTHSLDPIKIYGDDDTLLRSRFARIILPLLGVAPDTGAAAVIMSGLSESARRTYGVGSTRDLLDKFLAAHADSRAGNDIGRELYRARLKADYISGLPYGRSLIDPRGVDVPAIDTSASILVLRTYGLSVRKAGMTLADADIEKQVAEFLLNAAALYTSTRFARSRRLCATVGDEMSFLANSPDILDELVNKPVRMGRKESNILLAGTQDAGDLGEEFKTISIHTIMRQETNAAARRALELASMPESDLLVESLRQATSPRIPGSNRVQPGREGEAWFTDSISPPARIRRLPMLLSAENAAADTTASSMREA